MSTAIRLGELLDLIRQHGVQGDTELRATVDDGNGGTHEINVTGVHLELHHDGFAVVVLEAF